MRKENKVELNIVAEHCPDARALSRAATLEDAYLYFTSNKRAQTVLARAC
ncbi:hypothetical protein [Colwellia hornerae]|nr:hypothetical protein [Colwellia hornerae]